jgi:acyl-CoA synthetase (AMP-forming)/AMP-acid ligase II
VKTFSPTTHIVTYTLKLHLSFIAYTYGMQGSQLLYSKLQTWAESSSQKDCLIDVSSSQRLTYSQLIQAVIAVQLYLGEPSKTIIVVLPSGIVDAVLWLASLSGGHRLVPLSPALTESEYQEAVQRHKPDLIVLDTLLSAWQSAYTIFDTTIQDILDSNPRGLELLNPIDGTVYLSTSGSTGPPKGIVLNARQCIQTAEYIVASHKLTEQDRCLTPLPFYHVNAPIVSLLSSVMSGGCCIIAPRYRTTEFWDWVHSYQPTWISIVPTMVAMLLSTKKPDWLVDSSIRFVRTASSPLPESNLHRFENQFGLAVIETYGISEAASTIFANPVPPGIHKPASVGVPVGIDVEIREPGNVTKVAEGHVGEVTIAGDNVITAYDSSDDQSAFNDGWFRTGDLGYLDSDGYLFLTGRIKDIIVRGGENIFPREIEEVITTFDGIAEAVVVGQADALYGEKVIAFIVPIGEPDIHLEEQLLNYLHEKLSRYKVPTELFILDELPKTKAGKVDKPYLRMHGGNA